MKDHYKILGVTPLATAVEIKKAFRALAMQYHPDKNQDNIYTDARFLEIHEAYSILSDPAKKEAYDKERWLNGMGKQSQQAHAITPSWLVDVSKKLNDSLAGMDTHRISHGSLKAYILLIISDAHIGVLLQQKDGEATQSIVNEIIKATKYLEPDYLPEIITRLHTIAAGTIATHTVDKYERERARQEFKERLFPFIVLIITLTLCLMMYYYGNSN